MRFNYRSRWSWAAIFFVLLILCYFFLGTVSAGMGVFGFIVGFSLSKTGKKTV